VVEDDPDQLALADLRVSMAGYQVRVAGSGQALKDSLRAMGLPDVLLLDVMLPDADGFAILAGMRRHPRLALLPVILLTAKDSPADISRGLALGADGYVTKPYTKNILADTIRRVLKTAPAG
jgi:DNA-binding response OmpR family regulator